MKTESETEDEIWRWLADFQSGKMDEVFPGSRDKKTWKHARTWHLWENNQ